MFWCGKNSRSFGLTSRFLCPPMVPAETCCIQFRELQGDHPPGCYMRMRFSQLLFKNEASSVRLRSLLSMFCCWGCFFCCCCFGFVLFFCLSFFKSEASSLYMGDARSLQCTLAINTWPTVTFHKHKQEAVVFNKPDLAKGFERHFYYGVLSIWISYPLLKDIQLTNVITWYYYLLPFLALPFISY